jgi:hypothetical protein
MAVVKKIQKREATGPPTLDLPQAKIQIVSAELQSEPARIVKPNGDSFMANPNVNCRLKVLDDFSDGEFDGVEFFDRFRLKQDEDTKEWGIWPDSKLGNLAKAFYGDDFFTSDAVFNADDLEGFIFQARIEPRQDLQKRPIPGSTVHFKTIMRVPKPKKKGKVGSEDGLSADDEAEMHAALDDD